MHQVLARIFHTRTEPLINTGALARCRDVRWLAKLFQQFVTSHEKLLKRLTPRSAWFHRAKAPVLMRFCWYACEISGLAKNSSFAGTLALLVLFAANSCPAAQTARFAVMPSADAFVRSFAPATNYGG